jgi:hypothetical protein
MSGFPSSGLKTSVCAAAAVTLTALIAWSFESYTGHLQQRADQSVNTAQVDSGSPDFARDARNG